MKSNDMLCEKCRSLRFVLNPFHQNYEVPDNLSFATHICVLHETRESFLTSIAQACHLCCLIQGQLGNREYPSPECGVLGAFVALAAVDNDTMSWKSRPSLVLSIMSRLGNGSLEEITEEVTDQYAEVLQGNIAAGRQMWCDGREGMVPPVSESISFPGVGLARLWRDACLANHRLCNLASPLQSTTPSPTRLLNVTNPSRPFLEETSGWQPYVALSYCWGPGEKFLTLRENVEEHRRGIAIEKLPTTFKHAIYATSQMGYTHVWIDALCIIQNDRADLGKELGHMGDIYRHAALTLRAASAVSSHAGFFHNRNPLQLHPCRVKATWAVSSDTSIIVDLNLAGSCSGHSYLSNRGWILQEDVLAPRAVTFGSQISWRCMEATADETRPIPMGSEASESGTDDMRLWLYAPRDVIDRRLGLIKMTKFEAWQDMVCGYSDRELSIGTDTLRALSGLADMFSQVHGTTYLAGLWRENLMADLAWYVSANDKRPVQPSHHRLTAPSWSWASVGKVRIRFPDKGWDPDRPVLDRRPSPAVVRHVFCASKDPINALPRPESRETSVQDRWLLRLAGPLRRLTLVLNRRYSEWRINNVVYGDSRAGIPDNVSASAISSRLVPRFPAALCLPDSSGRMVGEVSLDFSTLPPVSERAASANGNEELGVFCLPLLEEKLDVFPSAQVLCLILAPLSPDSALYRRLGIGYLTGEGWFSGSHGDNETVVECEIV
ncbi:heterokaryon incompatibility protein-domain-containing protein [Podospora aff. communis PSN243]|uniref:Heterokaryon incompatibility protein-domain-containing protein n=1 Tax=Podospora aff. communis PSN243 TaxID=3040156 RepID=A0AAV9GXF4_9PEZI|nr:heterokaryon incompatibility protein-domain-containing protein [Podospora aff. communis PSN243]